MQIVISDFGSSKKADADAKSNATKTVTATSPNWLSPEMAKRNGTTLFNAACDVYSFGCIMYEVLTREIPWGPEEFDAFTISSKLNAEPKPQRPTLEKVTMDAAAEPLKHLMVKCW